MSFDNSKWWPDNCKHKVTGEADWIGPCSPCMVENMATALDMLCNRIDKLVAENRELQDRIGSDYLMAAAMAENRALQARIDALIGHIRYIDQIAESGPRGQIIRAARAALEEK